MKLSPTQLKQLDDVVRETRITRGKNAGNRKETHINNHLYNDSSDVVIVFILP